MTTTEVIGYLKELGISLYKGDDGKPKMKKDTNAIVTPVTQAVIRRHRAEILRRLGIDPETAPEPPPSLPLEAQPAPVVQPEQPEEPAKVEEGQQTDETEPIIKQPVVPKDARIYLCRRDCAECEPGDEVYMWCWEGGPQWYYTPQYPPPIQPPPRHRRGKPGEEENLFAPKEQQ